MSNYIFDSYDVSSTLELNTPGQYNNTTNGTFRASIENNTQFTISLFHIVDLYNKDRFASFYQTNKNLSFTITFGEANYTAKFSSTPVYIPLGADMWKINVKVSGVL